MERDENGIAARLGENAPGGPGLWKGLVSAFVLIAVLAGVAYSNTFTSSFLFDDDTYIVKNPGIRSLFNVWPPSGTRFFGYLSFALNYRLSGLDTNGYHLTNFAIHLSNSMLVYLLVRLTFRTPAIRDSRILNREKAGAALALLTSVVFALHPVQTEAVTYITQRFTSIAFFFYLSSLVLFVSWRLTEGGGAPLRRSVYVISVVLALFAMKSKEISFTLPAVIVLYDIAFFENPGLWKRLARIIPFILTMAVIPLNFLLPGGTSGFGADVSEGMRTLQKMEMSGLSRYNYLITEFRVIVKYFRLLLCPVNQNVYYDYPHFTSILVPEVLASLVFLLAVAGGSVYLFARSVRGRNGWLRLVSAGVFWFFITISVESSVIPIFDAIYEHRLYLPGPGIFVSFGALLFMGFERIKGRGGGALSYGAAAAAAIVLLALPLGVATYKRNLVWKDTSTLWTDALKKSPHSPLVRLNMGFAYYSKGLYEQAEAMYMESVALDPDFHLGYYNLGVLYQERGMFEESIRELEAAVRIVPWSRQYRYNLGLTYRANGKPGKAVEQYLEIIAQHPSFIVVRYALADAYWDLGAFGEALENYRIFSEKAPDEYLSFKETARMKMKSIIAEHPELSQ